MPVMSFLGGALGCIGVNADYGSGALWLAYRLNGSEIVLGRVPCDDAVMSAARIACHGK